MSFSSQLCKAVSCNFFHLVKRGWRTAGKRRPYEVHSDREYCTTPVIVRARMSCNRPILAVSRRSAPCLQTVESRYREGCSVRDYILHEIKSRIFHRQVTEEAAKQSGNSYSNNLCQHNIQRSKKWLVRGLVKFVTAVA